ncbi:MAG: patatin-like phospholipase family protein, partial [Planctomycetaceae bacterium]|nr:patatin-like phospholipase family protein [Planctomycetaceae bacterium]
MNSTTAVECTDTVASPDLLNGRKIHLLLSGGGYRATIYHLGVLRFLYEHSDGKSGDSLLSQVTHLIGISGGSITAAHFAIHRNRYLENFNKACRDLLSFVTELDLRRAVLRKNQSASEVLKQLFKEFPLGGIASKDVLKLELLGTTLRTGGCVCFSTKTLSHRFEDPTQGFQKKVEDINCEMLQVRHAVMASAAFPPFFPPLKIEPALFGPNVDCRELGGLLDNQVADGGIRDNLGLDHYLVSLQADASPNLCIVSDAGATVDWSLANFVPQSLTTWGKRLMRVVEIQMDCISALNLARASGLVRIPIASVQHAQVQAAENEFTLSREIARTAWKTPTDLENLSHYEIFRIARHGFDVAKSVLTARDRTVEDVGFWDSLKSGTWQEGSESASAPPKDTAMLQSRTGIVRALSKFISGILPPRRSSRAVTSDVKPPNEVANHVESGNGQKSRVRVKWDLIQQLPLRSLIREALHPRIAVWILALGAPLAVFFLLAGSLMRPEEPSIKTANSLGIQFCRIRSAKKSFNMGAADEELVLYNAIADVDGSRDELPRHIVKFSRDFFMSDSEITRGQFIAVMT